LLWRDETTRLSDEEEEEVELRRLEERVEK